MKMPPLPTTLPLSKSLLRNLVKSETYLKADYDLLRISCKGWDENGFKVSHQIVVQLPLNNGKEYEKRLIAAAQAAHSFLDSLKSVDEETDLSEG